MTHLLNGGIPNHGFTHWWTMFNPRQLLVNALLLKAINEVGGKKHRWEVREYVLAAFQQYLRNQNMFSFWNPQRDTPEPMFSNNNYHPKSTTVENCVFPKLGRGNWETSAASLLETLEWSESPWELVSNEYLASAVPALADDLTGKSEKALPGDPVLSAELSCGSATELSAITDSSHDLVVTDPPFGGLLHYSELSDFFYVWLRLVLKAHYPDQFTSEYTPKTLEAVSNRARHPEDADAYYQRLLTASWRESHRILKPGGMLAFTFHHSEDAPWVSVLESLFDAGFYLEATYPIRSDETKGDGEFGSRKIEYDIVHVCRSPRRQSRIDMPETKTAPSHSPTPSTCSATSISPCTAPRRSLRRTRRRRATRAATTPSSKSADGSTWTCTPSGTGCSARARTPRTPFTRHSCWNGRSMRRP
jgi:adenine-specific DNA methylase